jgi:uncharacterized repeat protein (TIGR03803 family)
MERRQPPTTATVLSSRYRAGGEDTTLWSFIATEDGAQPFAGLIIDKKGDLYGTTFSGGRNGLGTVFEIAADGKEKVVYSFDSEVNGIDGTEPFAGLIQDESGNLYGASYGGGPQNAGVVFKISKH